MTYDITFDWLRRQLVDAEEHHKELEKQLGPHPDWPTFYANFIMDTIQYDRPEEKHGMFAVPLDYKGFVL